MSKMKLLTSFQLVTLLADVYIATVQARSYGTSDFLHLLLNDMN